MQTCPRNDTLFGRSKELNPSHSLSHFIQHYRLLFCCYFVLVFAVSAAFWKLNNNDDVGSEYAVGCWSVSTVDLGEPVLLLVWIPVCRFHHHHHLVFSDRHRHDVFPVVWRGQCDAMFCCFFTVVPVACCSGSFISFIKPLITLMCRNRK